MREESFLVALAVVIGIVTAVGAVTFHKLIDFVRDACYGATSAHLEIYGRHLWAIVLIPAAGGLAVGVITHLVLRGQDGHSGVIDVMESVMRSRGGVRPIAAFEKILTSALTIGSGGSSGAEGPIVQIGAAIASGVAQLFGVARQNMPVLTGCGTAAGISAIFNSPFGGVLFTLEVILQDFSIRAFTPVMLASVIANVTTQELFRNLGSGESYTTIFHVVDAMPGAPGNLSWRSIPNFILLGLLCGCVGVTLTRLMHFAEKRFARVRLSRAVKPALGGLLLGILGAFYIITFGWFALGRDKPLAFNDYPMPAFFGDGYGVIQQMLGTGFFHQFDTRTLASLLVFWIVAKLFGTCFTLASGGSGGVIAPSLFLGAASGALLGLSLNRLGYLVGVELSVYALVGMGAVLAAVVHAPLASILILFDITRDHRIFLPAMLATIIATGLARALFPDSIYTLALRLRGVRSGTLADLSVLRRLTIEQVQLDPATVIRAADPFQRVVDLTAATGNTNYVAVDERGLYQGMVVMDEIRTALLEREAIPLLLVQELIRNDLPLLSTADDLATVLETFGRHEISHLAVTTPRAPGRVVGLIGRAALMRRYHRALSETR